MDTLKKIFFGLVMVVIGLGFAGVSAHTSYTHVSSEKWVPIDARILSVDWEKGEVGNFSQRRRYTGYEAVALYEYDYGGETFQSRRLRFNERMTSRKEQERALYDQLKGYQRDGTPVSVQVNPRAPSEAVMYREIRWPIVAVQAVIGAIGLLFGLAVLKEAFS